MTLERNWWLILGLVVGVTGLVLVLFGYSPTNLTSKETVRCLNANEKAVYEVMEEGRPGRIRVSVLDEVTNTMVWSREYIHPTPDIASPVHLGKCSFFMPQSFNFDWERGKPQLNYSFEIWKFEYFADGGMQVVVTSENKTETTEDIKRYYSGTSFSIDPSETYISLERGYLGNADYALVIKKIETGEDVFELSLRDIVAQHPSAAGSFDTGTWYETPDGVYLDSDTYDGSRIGAQIYIKRDTWEVEILPTPEDYLPGVERRGYPLSPYWAYSDVIVWAGGVIEVQDALLEDAIAEGKQKNLIVANLRTGEREIVETVPIVKGHRFNLTWLSMNELEYTMPDGTKKIYYAK